MEYFNTEGQFFTRAIPEEQKPPIWYVGMLAEFFGSLLFVLVAAGAGAIQPLLSHPDSVLFALASGFGLMAAIWIAASIPGGGQINPIVTITLWVYSLFEPEPRKFWWLTKGWGTLYYPLLWIIAQFVGVIVAGALLLAIFGGGSNLGRPVVGTGFAWGRAFGFEIIGTTILLLVYLYFFWRSPSQKELRFAAIPIGLTYLVLATIGAFISSASFNWWRHLGPTIISNTWNEDGDGNRNVDWIWYAGPILGSIVALGLFGIFILLIGKYPQKFQILTNSNSNNNSNSNQKFYVSTQKNRKLKKNQKSKRYGEDKDKDNEVDELAEDLF